ncbi:MAG: glycosyl hydrolase, partial [Planctomycetota bacterium]|nr:glycosyl hydrolase [Planctomycetota bacterium]
MSIEERVEDLLRRMTRLEKIGQMRQVHAFSEQAKDLVRQGAVGSFINVMGGEAEELQRIAIRESRLGIPLLFGRDVIHGFKTVFPIPLGMAASFNSEIAYAASHAAAREAAAHGIHWTFAPMIDIARDPRWGRIAEGCGEDPYLASRMGEAMVRGFQAPLDGDTAEPNRDRLRGIAACAKHYVGYGAAEAGRDYNTTLIPERTLRNVYLPPFQACVAAGVATVMSAFNDLNDIPASGNAFTIRGILKGEWRFDGFVVSDWAAITEMINHGYCADSKAAALAAMRAGVDMEMVSLAYAEHLNTLISEGQVPEQWLDEAVRRILRVKFRLGLFDGARPRLIASQVVHCPEHLAAAYRAALESCVLLQNNGVLPLSPQINRLAVIGPLADSPAEQMGCW